MIKKAGEFVVLMFIALVMFLIINFVLEISARKTAKSMMERRQEFLNECFKHGGSEAIVTDWKSTSCMWRNPEE